jgi:SAM-dependent methyltransferase
MSPEDSSAPYDLQAVSEPSRSGGSRISWEEYYKAVEGRTVRPLFIEALGVLPSPHAGEYVRVAVDLGCGDGTESLALLARGWSVVAVDGAPEAIALLRTSVPPEDAARLTTVVGAFHEVELPDADFLYAGLSLPFCAPGDFANLWRAIVHALADGGVFAGHFLGPRDSWASAPDMTFQTRDEVEALLEEFNVLLLREQDEDGAAVSGPKHWHVFHVIATKVPSRLATPAH